MSKAAWFFYLMMTLGLLAPLTAVGSFDITSRDAVFTHFQIEPLALPGNINETLSNRQTSEGLDKLLHYMDPTGDIESLLYQRSNILSFFDDPEATSVLTEFQLARTENEIKRPEFYKRILDIKRQAKSHLPLEGLRVALDPGHMGGMKWARRTGKVVGDGKGNYLFEGIMVQQTAMLLKNSLEHLGAVVLLTREGLHPVTNKLPETFDFKKVALFELESEQFSPWFQGLLKAPNPIRTSLEKINRLAFEDSPFVAEFFSERRRFGYFIKEDLEARRRKIQNFNPDITLVIHFDITKNYPHSNSPKQTKIYVPGNFSVTEAGAREERMAYLKHLLNPLAQRGSVDLARNLLAQISSKLDLDLQVNHDSNGLYLEPGMFARNLYLTRYLNESPVVYLENFFYDRTDIFNALMDKRNPFYIKGEYHPYSDLIGELVVALQEGILNFVSDFE